MCLRDVPSLTLHRLLGPLPAVRTRFKSNSEHLLPYDVVIVDETSMVPLPMMARLLEALAAETRLVLVGDPDQLSSVDAGAILGDVVEAAAAPDSAMARCHVRLDRSHRQEEGSAIGPLSDAIRGARADDVVALLRSSDGLTFLEHDDARAVASCGGVRPVVDAHLRECRRAATAGDTATALGAASAVRILCAHRSGPFGANSWNDLAASWMLDGQRPPRNFAGRMLLATRNDLRNRLSNGDSGVVVAAGDRLRAAFWIAGEVRTFAPAQLESVETAFATTVHKSQGSEYDTVVVVLPPPGSPLARRELLYTAVTRATRRVVVVGSVESLVAAVTTRTPRSTGLVSGLCAPAT
jgi:exodeoxyribonuclease V alpha subunit